MARVVALIPDLLFGSRVLAGLSAAGHDVELVAEAGKVHERLAHIEVLVVDLTDAELSGVGLVRTLTAEGAPAGVRTLGFYSHVEAEARRQAEDAGFDLVVPRSRMAREGPSLVARVLAQ